MDENEESVAPASGADETTRAAHPEGWKPGERMRREQRSAPSSYDAEARTVEAVLATGYRVRRWYGEEELAITEEAVDLSRVELGQVRFLDHHNAYERGAILGVVEDARIERGALIGTIRFAETDAGRAAEAAAADGSLTGISVGYAVQRLVRIDDEDEEKLLYRAERWELLEVSAVSVPADPYAAMRSLNPSKPTPDLPGKQEVSSMNEDQPAGVESARNETADIDPTAAANAAAERTAAANEARTAERERVASLTDLACRAGTDNALLDAAVRDGTDLETFRAAVLDAKIAADAAKPTTSVPRNGLDEGTTRREAMIEALQHRVRPAASLSQPAREFIGMSLLELARSSLAAAGESTRGLSRSQIAERAFHSTSDFPFVLENVANKSLRAAYDAYPRTFTEFCREISAPDFKEMRRVQLGEAPQLERVGENGEFKRGTIAEGRESIKVDTYGKVVAITRQVVINDDLSAFTRVPQLFGTSIATLESDIVWALINANAVMSDGVALFHSDHNNLASGAALSVAAIGATRALMRSQTGLDGKTRINVRPQYLLVPTALETAAEQILNATTVPNEPAGATPTSMRSLQPVVEPRLDDGSTTAFYLAADPAVVDTIEYAYLEDNRGAYIESRMGFDVDGMEIKCRLDFGAAAIDHRGLAKNPGA